ncbi:hypothetical protein V8E55_010318 [Tylopilus felleus]
MLAFYLPIWKDLLEDAKRNSWIAQAIKNPFPSKSHDLKPSILESLVTTIVEWTQCGITLEPGYWLDKQLHVAALLLADITTWRSELKTIAVNVAPSAYSLMAPSDLTDRLQWVKSKAVSLLDQSLFLQDGLDENAIVKFFYIGSYRIADKCLDLFWNSVPVACLALEAAAYNCVLDGFARSGTSRSIPQFSRKSYSSIYHGILSMVDQVLKHEYHSHRLHEQLAQWGQEGW